MLGSEVGPQVHNLPSPKSNEQHSGANTKPLDSGVCALVRVSQRLLSASEVVHLGDNFRDCLFDAPQVGLNWLQLLGCLNGRPVLGIGTNIDIELDVSVGVIRGTAGWEDMSVR